jgi:xanthine dehydrogenase YagT iron-sulfur-binding subunit
MNQASEDFRDAPRTDPSRDRPDGWTRRDTLQLAGGAVSLMVGGLPADTLATERPLEDATVRTSTIELTVNGRPQRLDLDPRTSLLDLLRENLHLGGTKKGCNQGACGACTILVSGRRINACLTLAIMHDGAEITTIEGLATGETLHPLQTAFIEHDAFQCGYCTSGQIVSGVACIAEGHASAPDEIRAWMSGNICRCGAYPGIVAAIAEVANGS